MDFIPLSYRERRLMRILLRYDRTLYTHSVPVTKFNIKQNVILQRLCNEGLVHKSDITGEETYVLTDLGRHTAIYNISDFFWKTITFLIPTIISVVSTAIALISLIITLFH